MSETNFNWNDYDFDDANANEDAPMEDHDVDYVDLGSFEDADPVVNERKCKEWLSVAGIDLILALSTCPVRVGEVTKEWCDEMKISYQEFFEGVQIVKLRSLASNAAKKVMMVPKGAGEILDKLNGNYTFEDHRWIKRAKPFPIYFREVGDELNNSARIARAAVKLQSAEKFAALKGDSDRQVVASNNLSGLLSTTKEGRIGREVTIAPFLYLDATDRANMFTKAAHHMKGFIAEHKSLKFNTVEDYIKWFWRAAYRLNLSEPALVTGKFLKEWTPQLPTDLGTIGGILSQCVYHAGVPIPKACIYANMFEYLGKEGDVIANFPPKAGPYLSGRVVMTLNASSGVTVDPTMGYEVIQYRESSIWNGTLVFEPDSISAVAKARVIFTSAWDNSGKCFETWWKNKKGFVYLFMSSSPMIAIELNETGHKISSEMIVAHKKVAWAYALHNYSRGFSGMNEVWCLKNFFIESTTDNLSLYRYVPSTISGKKSKISANVFTGFEEFEQAPADMRGVGEKSRREAV